jgi:hypothetical protein
MVEAAYTKPREAVAVEASRSGVELGATRKTRSSPCASAATSQSAASSGIRSGVIRPAPPAAARSRAKASTPYRSTGFQYVITSTGAPVRAICSTAAKTSRTREPPARACSTARWMTGPSMTGSEYGTPSSTMSTPASTIAVAAAIEPATSGKPSGR